MYACTVPHRYIRHTDPHPRGEKASPVSFLPIMCCRSLVPAMPMFEVLLTLGAGLKGGRRMRRRVSGRGSRGRGARSLGQVRRHRCQGDRDQRGSREPRAAPGCAVQLLRARGPAGVLWRSRGLPAAAVQGQGHPRSFLKAACRACDGPCSRRGGRVASAAVTPPAGGHERGPWGAGDSPHLLANFILAVWCWDRG